MTPPSELNIVTLVTKNQLAFARVLADSVTRHHPHAKIFVICADHIDGYFEPKNENFITVEIDELRSEINNIDTLCFKYKNKDLPAILKPFALSYLFKKHNLPHLIYFDPDILVTHSLQPLLDLLNNHDIILTPHATSPYLDTKNPTDKSILKAGIYNLGFIGLANTTQTQDMLTGWHERICKISFNDYINGLLTDQKWFDLIPGYYETYILREPEYNVAYWNLHERTLTVENETLLSNGKPLRFFHFSGYDVNKSHVLSKYQDRHHFAQLQDISRLFSDYKKMLIQHGYRQSVQWPYSFDYFKNNEKIPDYFRKIYWDLSQQDKEKFGNPFKTTQDSFFTHLTQMKNDELPLTLQTIYRARPDLQAAFPDIKYANKIDYLTWFFQSGMKENHLNKNLFVTLKEYLLEHKFGKLKSGVNIFGYFNSVKGMGEVVRSDIRCLEKTTYPFTLCNVVDKFSVNINDINHEFSLNNPYKVNLFHINADQTLPVVKQLGPDFLIDHFNIGSWAWELSCFPKDWYSAFNIVHEVWVLSDFMQNSLALISPVPVVRVPPSLEIRDIEKPSFDKHFFGIPENKYVFLFMFDFSSVFTRKNPQGAIEAFINAFTHNDDAVFIIKHSHANQYPDDFKKLLALAQSERIILFDKTLSREQVDALMYHADCYVSLHRSEGFGLTMAEAMSLGKPVIATAYSGNMDFMTSSNSYLVNYKLVPIDRDYGPYLKDWEWAEPDLAHAAKLMRYVYEHPKEALAVGQKARDDIRQYYSPEVVAKIYQERLEAIMLRLPNSKSVKQPLAPNNVVPQPANKINIKKAIKLTCTEPGLIKKFINHLWQDGPRVTWQMLIIKTNL